MANCITDRVLKIIENKNLSIRSFEVKIGTSNGQISKCIARKSAIKSDVLAKILEFCPEIDANWLVTGEGEMYKNNNNVGSGRMREEDMVSRELYDMAVSQKDKLIEQLDERIVSQAHFLEMVAKSYMTNSEQQNGMLKEIYHLLVEERELLSSIGGQNVAGEISTGETSEIEDARVISSAEECKAVD